MNPKKKRLKLKKIDHQEFLINFNLTCKENIFKILINYDFIQIVSTTLDKP